MVKPGSSRVVKRIEIRKDLKQFWIVEDEENSLIKCTVDGCLSKSSDGPTVLKYNSASGWFNFERHLVSFVVKVWALFTLIGLQVNMSLY